MQQSSYALLTTTGRSKEAAALANGIELIITHIAIGDGVTVPSGGETKLYNEVSRKKITGHGLVSGATDVVYFDIYLAADEGPYTIREAGLFDSEGNLIAIAHYDPPINKPTPSSGQAVEGTIRMEIAFSNASNVLVKVDSSMQVALQRLTICPWIPVVSLSEKTPPSNPKIGDVYVVPEGATGVWSGQKGNIAEFTSAGWAINSTPNGHGIGLPDGRVFTRVNGIYIELLATRSYVDSRSIPLAQLNGLPWIPVISMTLSTPPAKPLKGDVYLVPSNAIGVWASNIGQIAEWNGSKWLFTNAPDGHGIGLPDGQLFQKISGVYQPKIALDVQSNRWNFSDTTGTTTALTANLTLTPGSIVDGFSIVIKTSIALGDNPTINVNKLGSKPILTPTGVGIKKGSIAQNVPTTLVYSKNLNGWVLPLTSGGIPVMCGFRTTGIPSGLTIPSRVPTLLPYSDIQFDTEGGYSNGYYTVKRSGVYTITASHYYDEFNAPTFVYIAKNGEFIGENAAHRYGRVLAASTTIYLNEGDVINAFGGQDSGSNYTRNYFTTYQSVFSAILTGL